MDRVAEADRPNVHPLHRRLSIRLSKKCPIIDGKLCRLRQKNVKLSNAGCGTRVVPLGLRPAVLPGQPIKFANAGQLQLIIRIGLALAAQKNLPRGSAFRPTDHPILDHYKRHSSSAPFLAFPAKAGTHVFRGHRLSPVKRDW